MSTPVVTEDEIANAAGVGDVHDGVNFMRAACVIAVEKAQQSFEPMLEALRHRAVHIMRRLYPVVEHIIQKTGNGLPVDAYNRPFQDMIRRTYDKVRSSSCSSFSFSFSFCSCSAAAAAAAAVPWTFLPHSPPLHLPLPLFPHTPHHAVRGEANRPVPAEVPR
jgi:hypothetical protein